MKKIVTLAASLMISSAASADVTVAFVEGAPKDRFVITNTGACDLSDISILLDLTGSASGVIFDVSALGAGVDVFQPFEIVAGAHLLSERPIIGDGDRSVTLQLNGFPSGETVAFTIDVDDTRGGREITVTDAELSGATASFQTTSLRVSNRFGESSNLVLGVPTC